MTVDEAERHLLEAFRKALETDATNSTTDLFVAGARKEAVCKAIDCGMGLHMSDWNTPPGSPANAEVRVAGIAVHSVADSDGSWALSLAHRAQHATILQTTDALMFPLTVRREELAC